MKYFTYLIILVVAVAVFAGFFIVGSPSEERLRRFDEKKLGDLQLIQGEVIYYWQSKQKLPGSLEELNDSIRGFIAPFDPQSGEAYEYNILGDLNFTLCASFNREYRGAAYNSPRVMPAKPPYPASEALGNISNWDHAAGRTCFERTIDPDLYKPQNQD